MLDGRAVFLTNATTGLGGAIAGALAESGAHVTAVDGGFTGLAAADAAFARASSIDAVVHVCVDERALVAQPLVETGPTEWDERGEALIREAIVTLQAAHARFVGGTGRIVLVAPTAGFTGARDLTPYSMAVEGIRALAKSAARQCGPNGITVNCVLVAPDLVSPTLIAATTFHGPPVVGRLPDVGGDVVEAIALFAGPGVGGVTGATIVVDGGSVMAP